MTQYILAIDQGTTGTTALLIDHDLNVRAKVNHEFPQHYPKPGWVEHDPEEIWTSTLQAVKDCLAGAKIEAKRIAAIGITNQRETTLLWDRKTGKPAAKAIVWQDRRTAERCRQLKKEGLEKAIQKKTGLVCDPYFSATKLEWLLKKHKGDLCFGTVDSFLLWKLTGGQVHATDATNASRTMLLNLETLAWDKELLKIFGVPEGVLPRIVSCSEKYGSTKNVPGLPDGIPIAGMAGDQQAALVGQACFETGEAKCTYGTGSFILINIGREPKPSHHGCLTTLAYQLENQAAFAWEGSAFIAGAAVQWLRDGLKIIKKSSEVETLAASVEDSGGVVFVPALVGLGAPHWRSEARGLISGITRGTTNAHIARACLEGIAFLQYDILEAMAKDLKKPLGVLKVDGGAAANNLLMQFQSDILQVPISRPAMLETTALGAAFLAGLAVGVWKDLKDIRKNWKEERRFVPQMQAREVTEKVARWRQEVAKC
ncbi:MAG: glycerol kinase GlpK [Deltaproteobacteria bacterium]|nr:glycerol kinase GlpK [Deltaproteobacteria bacterium]MBI4223330.1 glycerol kinase GlpK [Deltaproteobacteria bacterium]